jgi:hypothetical protein
MLGRKDVDEIMWVWLKILKLTHPFPMAFNLFDDDCELWPFKLLNINLPRLDLSSRFEPEHFETESM